MKLSQFKGSNIRKKMQFINGEMKEAVLANEQINGDINFYELSIDKLEVINNEVINKLKDGDNNEFLMYKLIPYVSDVECDMTFDEFMEMMNNPSRAFVAFTKEIMASINDMFGTIDELSKAIDSTNQLISNPIMTEKTENVNSEIEKVEEKVEDEVKIENNISKEDGADLGIEILLDNLYEQLRNTSDRTERKKLIQRITDLQGV